jgi:alkanesulfonate monooxygenase SsuD/methylene tetrahydromethanopterin reductase-like flavin-dependent oxidoreductase (luciferase family)
MNEIGFAWHMPSFPVDGSRKTVFVDQILHTLERIGDRYDSAWADDHFWPWAQWQTPETDFLECMTTISYLAALFPRMKFGSSVLCQSYRSPGLIAKMAANLQLFSGGRFLFGIGAGWMEREYLAYGIEFPKPAVRIAQLEETVQIVRLLWTETPASFEGKYYQIKNAYCEPKPEPIPPMMIGGGGEQLTLRVVAKYADWWNIPGGSLENYAHKLDVLRDHCTAIGRNYDEIKKTWSAEAISVAETEAEARRIAAASPFNNNQIVGTPQQVAAQLQKFVDVGCEYFIMRFLDFPSTRGIELFADEVMPLL